MAPNRSSNKQSKGNRGKSEAKKKFIEVGRKLGVSIPGSLLLLANMSAVSAPHTQSVPAGPKASTELQKLRSNEVADQLLGYVKKGVILASSCEGGIHGDSHVNVNDPDITNDGKHSNVHTDNHGDSCR